MELSRSTDPKVDWVDNATGKTYDAVGNFLPALRPAVAEPADQDRRPPGQGRLRAGRRLAVHARPDR
ncbi:hypothetical protein ACFQZ4_47280 [Catellatospora coxensis]